MFMMLRSATPLLRRLASVLGLLLLLGLTGCAHYHLGTETVLPFSTLYVAPVQNKTMVPQAQAIVSTMLRDELLRDGRVTLVNSPDEADAVLTITLVNYRRDVATVKPGDTGLARKFALTLDASATLHDNKGQKDYFEHRAINAVRDDFTDGGQLQAEYQTLPLLAEALAKKASHAVLDVW